MTDSITYSQSFHLAVKKTKYRKSYFKFVCDFWSIVEARELIISPYIEYLCKEVQTILNWTADWNIQDSKSYDLLINVAPGTTKSTIASSFSPAYLWILNPDSRMIASSYSAFAVKEITHKFMKLLRSDEFLALYPNLKLEEENITTQTNQEKGIRYATSTNGSVTSLHGDIILLDDHNKPPKIVRDENGRIKLELGATLTEIIAGNSWHDDVLSTRKTDQELSRTIYIQQRVHKRDLSGHVLNHAQNGGINLKHICLPAIINKKLKKPQAFAHTYINGKLKVKDDLKKLYTRCGYLAKERLGKKILEKKKKVMGSFIYNAQFQQNPRKERGRLIKAKWFKYVDSSEVPDNLVRHFYSDTSEGKANSDNMATIVWSLYESKAYIWEVIVTKKIFSDYIGFKDSEGRYINKFYDNLVKKHGGTWESKHFFEAKSTGTPYIQYINAQTPYRAIADIPKGAKRDRVELAVPTLESGRIILVKKYDNGWIDDFIDECINFTGKDSDIDDRVDTLTGLIRVTEFEGSQFQSEKEKKKRQARHKREETEKLDTF
ncbi:MAG: hypothetical protein ACFFDH_00025 [Promethearchaeota archaeon]